jgi:hypothetical protein
MSLWLQGAIEALEDGDYVDFKANILPFSPIPVPSCLLKEIEFGERYCLEMAEPLFPIRFLWLLEANEQRLYGLCPLERSFYHPEKIFNLWTRASTDPSYLQKCEVTGLVFDFAEKAIKLKQGWLYIGGAFIEDFLEIETTVGFQLLFPDPVTHEGRPAFHKLKQGNL